MISTDTSTDAHTRAAYQAASAAYEAAKHSKGYRVGPHTMTEDQLRRKMMGLPEKPKKDEDIRRAQPDLIRDAIMTVLVGEMRVAEIQHAATELLGFKVHHCQVNDRIRGSLLNRGKVKRRIATKRIAYWSKA